MIMLSEAEVFMLNAYFVTKMGYFLLILAT